MANSDRAPRSLVKPALAAAVALLTAQFLPAMIASARADAAQDGEARNKAIVQRGFDAWKAGTGSPYELLADDARWTITGNSAAAGTYAGREAFLDKVIRPFVARMDKQLVPEIRHMYADGDSVIVHFDAAGTARDGKPYRNTYAWFMRLQDERIVEATAFFDSIAFDEFWSRVTPAR